MIDGNRSQAAERLRAAASAILATDDDTALDLVTVAVLLLVDGRGQSFVDSAGQYGAVMPGEPILFATVDAIDKFNDCAEETV